MDARRHFQTIDEYMNIFPKDVQDILEKLRQTIQKAAPAATQAISYRIPTFRLHGNLVHFAAYKNHIGFYPASGAIEAFKKELSGYKGGKGSVQFPINQPLPLKLIGTIVKYRVKENEERKKGKKESAGAHRSRPRR
jgi:uncharacterized protein YdhG (YjbR/CyaY superfamily)